MTYHLTNGIDVYFSINQCGDISLSRITRVCLKNYSGSVEIVHFNQITVVAIHKIAR